MASSTARGFCDVLAESRYTILYTSISTTRMGKYF
jgi:hypothetical protein